MVSSDRLRGEVALVVGGGNDADGRSSGWVRRLARYCWRSPLALVVGSAAALAAAAVGVVVPLVIRQIVDAVTGAGGGSLVPWVLLLGGLGATSALLSYVSGYSASRLGCDVEYFLRTDMFRSVARLDGAQQDRLQTGQVISRSTNDVAMVVRLLSAVPSAVASVLQFAAVLVVMLVLSPILTGVIALVVAVVFIGSRQGSRSFFPARWDVSQREGVVASIVEAAVTGVRVVKGFGREHAELRKLESASTNLFAAEMRASRLTVIYLPLFWYTPIVGQIGVLAVGGYLALHGQLTLGTFVAFSTYLAAAMGPMGALANRISDLPSAHASAVRIFDIIDSEPTIVDASDAGMVPPALVGVELQHVTFGYRPGSPVLDDVSLRIEPGETVALVGGAGSGKSTVALLLARFYDPWNGSVYLGEQDLRAVTLASLRSRLGMVLEDNFLVADTIHTNIAFHRTGATTERVMDAARAAEADEFIMSLPDGYDTVVGERGLTLSGGQRQRIALARAILDDPDVLVLDDATSAVDAGVEADIHATLRDAARGRTTVLIAHRRGTLALADRIVVMHRGRVIDVGTHEELTGRCARYRLLLTGVDVETGEPTADASAAGAPAPAGAQATTPELWSRPAPDDLEAAEQGLTSDQRALVAALPPALDSPRIDLAEAERADQPFGLRRLWPTVRRGVVLSSGLVIAEASLLVAQPWLARHAIDQGVTHPSSATLWTMCGLGLLAVALIWLATTANLRIVNRNSSQVLYLLRIKIFAHLQRLGLDYYEREPAGQIMTRFNGDPQAIADFIGAWVGLFVVRSLTLLGVIGLMLVIDPRLAVAALASTPLFIIAVVAYRRISTRAYTAVREHQGRLNALLQESVAGIRVTQAFGGESASITAYERRADKYRSVDMTAKRQLAGFLTFAELCHQAAVVVVVCLGATYISDGSLSAGGLIAFLLYVAMLFEPIMVLSEVVDGYQLARVGLHRIRDLLNTPTSTAISPTPTTLPELRGQVRFDNVCFSYPTIQAPTPTSEALAGIDLDIEAGQTVAIVGRTGAGKSTIVKLMARFYDPTFGRVLVDDHDLRQLDLRQYRSRLGFVPQESYLFEGTIRDVIAYARPDAADYEVEAAARTVGAHDMIASFEHGYLHPVGEGGRTLSAGQRQLLALARAELVQPTILLLDEATASLDLATEAAVAAATRRVASSRTTVVIAHRLTTAETADRIIVLADGQIRESGTHQELLSNNGPYARLWAVYTGVPRQ